MITPIICALLMTADNPISGKKLVWADEFTQKAGVNEKNWFFNDGPVYNDELEKYTKKAAGNAFLRDGKLVLEARKKDGVITSGRLQSIKAWKYGYFEAKMKVPGGKGTWPAFWMLGDNLRKSGKENPGWPMCGEIDIMEFVGYDPTRFHFSLHTKNFNHIIGTQITHNIVVPDALEKEHTFGLDWSHDYIRFYYDGKQVFEKNRISDDPKDWPFDQPFYIILNLAIGGGWGGAQGVDDSIFPAHTTFDYVRVYQ